jgi:hypothetical protein
MSRMYTVVFESVAVTALQDLFALVSSATRPLRVMGLQLAQSTDFGDAQEEGIRLRMRRGQTVAGSGGTAPVPVPVDTTDAAAQFAARVNDTTQAGTGTIVTVWSDVWNVRMPYLMWFPPGLQPTVDGGGNRLTVEIAAAPADSITMSGTIWVEELP